MKSKLETASRRKGGREEKNSLMGGQPPGKSTRALCTVKSVRQGEKNGGALEVHVRGDGNGWENSVV